jgi:hypothetical protein
MRRRTPTEETRIAKILQNSNASQIEALRSLIEQEMFPKETTDNEWLMMLKEKLQAEEYRRYTYENQLMHDDTNYSDIDGEWQPYRSRNR